MDGHGTKLLSDIEDRNTDNLRPTCVRNPAWVQELMEDKVVGAQLFRWVYLTFPFAGGFLKFYCQFALPN